MSYRFLEHTADVKFQAEGKTVEEVFTESAMALKETICGKITVLELEIKEINIKGDNFEGLLYNFLEEFLFLLDSEGFLVSRIKEINIDKEKFSLSATISGDNAENYKFTNDVKAITYNEMYVKSEKSKWFSQVVLDV
jgi:SHS2 domain-containing protein